MQLVSIILLQCWVYINFVCNYCSSDKEHSKLQAHPKKKRHTIAADSLAENLTTHRVFSGLLWDTFSLAILYSTHSTLSLLPSVVSLLETEQRRCTKHETRTMLRRRSRTPATDTLTMMMNGISPFTSSTVSMARAWLPGGGRPGTEKKERAVSRVCWRARAYRRDAWRPGGAGSSRWGRGWGRVGGRPARWGGWGGWCRRRAANPAARPRFPLPRQWFRLCVTGTGKRSVKKKRGKQNI